LKLKCKAKQAGLQKVFQGDTVIDSQC
jgi:hypothetical protein